MLLQSKLLQILLYLPAKLYELAIRIRIVLYEYSYLETKSLENIVISIGNITLGGTGKTPLVEYIASYLTDENIDVGILTRGYKRRDSSRSQVLVSDGEKVLATIDEAGDEPFMLANKLKGVKIVVGADRYQSGSFAERELGCNLLLLDDGFQYLRLKRDLNILVLDATDPFGGGEMVPFGRMREPIYGLKRAEAIIVTRSDRAFDQDELHRILERMEMKIPVIYSYHDVVGLRDIATNKVAPIRTLNRTRLGIICAIGNPQVFVEDLQAYQAEVVSQHIFPDHYHYNQADIDKVVAEAKAAGATCLATTEKDAVKFSGLSFGDLPVYIIEIKVQFEDEVKFKSLLLRTAMKKRISSSKSS